MTRNESAATSATPPAKAADAIAGPTKRVVPRRAMAQLVTGNRDPLTILSRQNDTRLPELVGLRAERMSASPFTFFRGTAAIMAADQARDPHSGILVAACGDAHLSNFGFYASPQRTLLFDLNDFDEAAFAPWEWDVKRLVTSVMIGGQATNRAEEVIDQAAGGAVEAYSGTLRAEMANTPMKRYFRHFDPHATAPGLDKRSRKALIKVMAGAERRTGVRAARRLTQQGPDGQLQFIEAPPGMTRARPEVRAGITEAYEQYRRSTYIDIRALLAQYEVRDLARRAVGVGSVGTRCYVALLEGSDGSTMILQVKEAGRSVLEEYGEISQPDALTDLVASGGQRARAVGMQRILQAYSDPFLGHIRMPDVHYYVRQFHDMKGSFDVEALADGPFVRYSQACARILARAHAQSPRAAEVVSYIGKGRRVADSIVAWSRAYAEVSLADYQAFIS